MGKEWRMMNSWVVVVQDAKGKVQRVRVFGNEGSALKFCDEANLALEPKTGRNYKATMHLTPYEE